MNAVTVSTPRRYVDRGWPAVSATIGIEGKRYEIYCRASHGPLSTQVDPFLAVALLPAMRVGVPLRVQGAVSPLLLEHLTQFQDIICTWYKTFRRIPVEAEPAQAVEWASERGVGCFFSGGIDSFYSALKHREEIARLVFVHGFDITLGDTPLRAKVATALHQAAAEMGKQLLEVETNVRDLLDVYTDWDKDSHGTGLASVALALAPQVSRIYIAATFPYTLLTPHGSHPLLDPLWSTGELDIVHDGCEASRWEKLESMLDNHTVRRYLHSCWEHPAGEYNCCRCKSCVLSMAFLRLHGVLDQFPAYDNPFDLDAMVRILRSDKTASLTVAQLYDAVQRQGTDPELAEALRSTLKVDPARVATGNTAPGPDAQAIVYMQTQLQEANAQISLLEWRLHAGQAGNAEMAELRHQVRVARARVARLRAQLYRLTSSISRRVTQPLRAARRALRATRRETHDD